MYGVGEYWDGNDHLLEHCKRIEWRGMLVLFSCRCLVCIIIFMFDMHLLHLLAQASKLPRCHGLFTIDELTPDTIGEYTVQQRMCR